MAELGVVWRGLEALAVPAAEPQPAMRDRFLEVLHAYEAGVEAGKAAAVPAPVRPARPAVDRPAPWFASFWPKRPVWQFATAAALLLAGVAGGTKALVFGIATLTDVHYSTSGEVVLTTLLGGLGTVFGPVMGAVLVTTMENYLAQFGQWVTVTQGAIFVVCVLAFRRGVIGEIGGALRLAL